MQVNPIIEKELKIKMRGWKAPALITVYLGFLGLIVLLFFMVNNEQARYTLQFTPSVAVSTFNTLAIFQLILILAITPALTAGSISGEKERQTLDLLLCTNLSTYKIVIGKIVVSIAHVILLITASLPILGTVFLYGGIGLTDILALFGFYIVTAFMAASMGIFYSTIFRKSAVAIIVTYITLLAMVFGTVVLLVLWIYLFRVSAIYNLSTNTIMAFLFANPFFGFGSVIGNSSASNSLLAIFNLSTYGSTSGFFSSWLKPWVLNVTFDIIISAVFIFLSAMRLKPVKRRRA